MMQDAGDGGTLPAGDAILIHLQQFRPIPDRMTSPKAQCQEGIAEALKVSRATISNEVSRLTEAGLIAAELRHVDGLGRRRKSYWLTAKGISEADRLVMALMEREVEVQTLEGETHISRLGAVNNLLGLNLPLSTLLSLAAAERRVQRGKVSGEEARFLPEPLERFVGRQQQLQDLRQWVEDGPESALLMSGMAGMGKTSVVRRIYEEQRGKRPLLWFTTVRWDTPETFIRVLGNLLATQGFPETLARLERTGAPAADQLAGYLELIAGQLQSQPRPLLILDDLHLLVEPLAGFLSDLLAVCHPNSGPRWLLLSRDPEALPAAAAGARMKSVVLEGLGLAEARELLPEESQIGQLLKNTGGHPLALKLIRPGGGEIAVDELHHFIETEILKGIDSGERRLAEVIAHQLLPTTPEDCLVERGLRRQQITRMVQRGILCRDDDGLISVHDLLREPLRGDLSAADSSQIHGVLAAHYRKRSDDEVLLRRIHHLHGAGESKKVAGLLDEWGQGLVDRGRTELFHVLDDFEPDIAADNVPLLRARILLTWGQPGKASAQLDRVGKGKRRAEALVLQARIARQLGDFETVQRVRQEIVASGSKGSWASGEAHNELGLCARLTGDLDQARHHYLEAVKVFEGLEKVGKAPPRSPGSVKALANLAMLQVELGDTGAAIGSLRKAAARAVERGDDTSRARCLYYQARLQLANPEIELDPELRIDPLMALEEAQTYFARGGDRFAQAQVEIELADYHFQTMDLHAAKKAVGAVERLSNQIGSEVLEQELGRLRSQLNPGR